MNVEELLELFDWQQRREVEYFGLVREIETGVVRQAPAPGQKGDGCIIWSNLGEADVDEVIRRDFRLLTVDAGDLSRPILGKLGFRVITHAQACRWHLDLW